MFHEIVIYKRISQWCNKSKYFFDAKNMILEKNNCQITEIRYNAAGLGQSEVFFFYRTEIRQKLSGGVELGLVCCRSFGSDLSFCFQVRPVSGLSKLLVSYQSLKL